MHAVDLDPGYREHGKYVEDRPKDNILKFLSENINTTLPIDREAHSCYAPLGMEHGHIKDEEISASSAFDYKSVGPHNARYSIEFCSLKVLKFSAFCHNFSKTTEHKAMVILCW